MNAAKWILGILALTALGGGDARALTRGSVTMNLVVEGRTLEEHAARGTQYVEALAGKEYSIRLRNHSGRRVAVALSVDGLNTIDAKTTSMKDASKWILGPYQTMTVDGWQVSKDKARRFFFTNEERSYGSWLGKTTNLGVISAAVFRERTPKPAPKPIYEGRSDERRSRAPRAEAESGMREQKAAGEADDDLAATGIGRKLDNRVRHVRFRAESKPATVLELRYEYHDALVRLGVLPEYHSRWDDLERRERASGFDDRFAPDPFD